MKNKFIALMMALALSTSCFAANGPTPLQSAVSSFWSEFNDDVIYTEKSVGIGTSTPDVTKALHVVGDTLISNGNIYIDGPFGGSQGIYLRDSGTGYVRASFKGHVLSLGSGNMTVQSGIGSFDGIRNYSNIPKITFSGNDTLFFNGSTETMRTTANNEVLIGKTISDGVNQLQVEEFTALGDEATGIKTKYLTGTAASTEGGTAGIAHGLNVSNVTIISVTVLVEYATDTLLPPRYNLNAGYDYSFSVSSTNVVIENSATESENILSKPVRVHVIYKNN